MNDPTGPVISVAPITPAVLGRGQDLGVRVTAPARGRDLPVVVFSHAVPISAR